MVSWFEKSVVKKLRRRCHHLSPLPLPVVQAWFKHGQPHPLWGIFPRLAYEVFDEKKDGWKITMKYFQNVVSLNKCRWQLGLRRSFCILNNFTTQHNTVRGKVRYYRRVFVLNSLIFLIFPDLFLFPDFPGFFS